MAEIERPKLAIAAKVIDDLQKYPSRDEVELVVDLGLDWREVEPSLNALVENGVVAVRQSDGEPVYELARSAESRPLADLLFG